jgi:hypothetical protein
MWISCADAGCAVLESWICGRIRTLGAASSLTRTEIPPSARQVTECVYHVLKSDLRTTSVTVWARPEGVQHIDPLGTVIVEYGFLNKDKKEQQWEIIVWGARGGQCKGACDEREQFRGAYAEFAEDPVHLLEGDLITRCHADGGYFDQVLFTDGYAAVKMGD